MSAAKQYLSGNIGRLVVTSCPLALYAGLVSAQSGPAPPSATDTQTFRRSGPCSHRRPRRLLADHLPGDHPPPDYSLVEPLSLALTSRSTSTIGMIEVLKIAALHRLCRNAPIGFNDGVVNEASIEEPLRLQRWKMPTAITSVDQSSLQAFHFFRDFPCFPTISVVDPFPDITFCVAAFVDGINEKGLRY